MASIHLSQTADTLGNNHVEKLISPDSADSRVVEISSKYPIHNYDADDEFGEPESQPRVGDEYQAELPSHNQEFGIVLQTRNGRETENFAIGLPIPLTCTSDVKHDVLGSCGSSIINSDFMHVDSNCAITADEQWTAIEKDSFLLGLYIFEKNFVEIRRFVGAKQMGSLLSFYYGKFYGSQEYRRWSQCRKMKSKKCIYGQRIFTGPRQQELLSRLLPKVSEECQSALLEVSKTFADEKMSLPDYVSSLKVMVGMGTLVEAIGIGTGKRDLTGIALESPKTNQAIPVRPEIPTGKACSSLTTEEIVKFLSGNYRLSKARSNDLFWEAIWPRLLANGWHSEQPRSKQYLVFLTPGIKKFSLTKQVKGNHYFDSVTDILSKVAQEPGLIELDTEEDDNKKTGEHESTDTRQRHCYLQPKTPNRSNGAVFKFTVVDTSLPDGKARELRILPDEVSDVFVTRGLDEDSDKDTCEDVNDVSGTVGTSVTGNRSLKKVKFDGKQCKKENDVRGPRAFLDPNATLAPESKNKKVSKGPSQSRKVSKSNVKRNKKQGGPIVERHQVLSTCDQKESLGLVVSSCMDKLSSRGSENLQTMMDLDLSRKPSVRSEQPHSNPVPLRHSTRNRPPTSRALEALADGYLTVNRKRKGKESQDAAPRPSQRVPQPVSVDSGIEEADSTNTRQMRTA